MELTDALWAAAILTVLLYYYLTSWFGFFDHRRVAFRRPYPLVGNMAPAVFKQKHIALLAQDFYENFKASGVGGVFEFRRPVFVVCDPELVRFVCAKEFDSFADRDCHVSEDTDGFFGRNLVALPGRDWRNVRATVNPVFTTSRMRGMFAQLSTLAGRAAAHLRTAVHEHESGKKPEAYNVEAMDFFTRVTTDIMASTVFGEDCDSLEQRDNEFFVMAKETTDPSRRKTLVGLGHKFLPQLMKLLGVSALGPLAPAFFRSRLLDAGAARSHGGHDPPDDVLQGLLDARHRPLPTAPQDADEAAPPPRGQHAEMPDDDVAAQALLFLMAGREPTTTLLSFLAYLLAVHPEVQAKVQAELKAELKKSGKITYEAVENLKYLDMVISETLRMYPPTPIMDRKCSKALPMRTNAKCGGYVITVGDCFWIPVYALHRDPEFFPDPDKFLPERFSEDNKHNIRPFTYIPFGVGPRNCIGMRFALIQTKIVMAHLLARYNLTVVDKTPVPLKLSRKSTQMTVDDGMWIGFESREDECVLEE